MGSKADDVSHGGAAAAVLLDALTADMKRDSTHDVKETKDEVASGAEAAGKFCSIGTAASDLLRVIGRYLDDPRRTAWRRSCASVSSLMPACSQTAPMIGACLF